MAGAYGNMGVNGGNAATSTGLWQRYWQQKEAARATTMPAAGMNGLSLLGSKQTSGPGGLTSYSSEYGTPSPALDGLQRNSMSRNSVSHAGAPPPNFWEQQQVARQAEERAANEANRVAQQQAQQRAAETQQRQEYETAGANRNRQNAVYDQQASAAQRETEATNNAARQRAESAAGLAEREGANNRAAAAASLQYTQLAGPEEAPISRGQGASAAQEQASRDAAYTRSRTQIANTSRASLNGLSAELQRRGMGGGGYEAGQIGQTLATSAGDATRLAEQQARGEADQASHVADVDYQGRLAQRQQRTQSRDSLRGLLLGGRPRY